MTTKEDIKAKLNLIGLNLDKLPKFLVDTEPVIFNPSRLNNDKELKVYKYVSIKDIELYVTDCHRDDSIKEKYNNSMRFVDFIKQSEIDNEKSLKLINLFNTISQDNIKKVEDEQDKLQMEPPFLVHYAKSQYMMIVTEKNQEANCGKYIILKILISILCLYHLKKNVLINSFSY